MSSVSPQYTDSNARLVLPARFANSAVVVEEVSETELRVRKTEAVPEEEAAFAEEQRSPLEDEDRDFLLSLLAAPPKANSELKKAAAEHRRRHG